MRLLDPVPLGPRTAPNRVLFGPHVTNLGDDDRCLTARHVAYYERRARGGCGTIVVEGASVHESDWPYERAPLAARAAEGWRAIAEAGHAHGSLVIASLDHTGGQGSSAYHQRPLWAPSRVPEVATREVPKSMEVADIAAVVEGFAEAAAGAVAAGCDGVEINAGQHSLVRQFLSGLTNQRDDEWGADRARFARDVIAATRTAAGPDAVVGLRLSCDELAPWAGITPEAAVVLAAELTAEHVDYLVVVRGSIFSIEQTRPDHHQPTGINIALSEQVRVAVSVPVVLQGSVTDLGQAEWALGGEGHPAGADLVEMTRAQLADPDLVAKLRAGAPERIRPCTRCNQTCMVRDARNPIVTCIGEPTTGRETEDPDWYRPAPAARRLTVVGAGPAGLEAARVAAIRGHAVTVVDAADAPGGLAAVAGPNRALVEWQAAELVRLGVDLRLATTDVPADTEVVVQATGSQPGPAAYAVDDGIEVIDVAALRRGQTTLPDEGTVVLLDPIGGPIAVALAEDVGARAVLVTPDHIAGNELARTGDLAPANVRLARRGVRIERRAIVDAVERDGPGVRVRLRDRFSGEHREVAAAAVVDCGFRIPTDPRADASVVIGDAVAPRTVHEAVLEGRRAASTL